LIRSGTTALLALVIFSCQVKLGEENNSLETALAEEAMFGCEEGSNSKFSTLQVPVRRVEVMPNFAQYKDIRRKKKAFFDFLRPMVEEENLRIKQERKKLFAIFELYDKTGRISEKNRNWLHSASTGMRMKNFDLLNPRDRSTLLRKKDIVPASMVLAQAANESSWGTSRFAKRANNLFGQWCYTAGCGLVPTQRGANETHEIRTFATVNDAVRSYIRNINSYYAYRELRVIREEMRNEGEMPDGESLSRGLTRYSIRGEEYVKEIQSMIRVNRLDAVPSIKMD